VSGVVALCNRSTAPITLALKLSDFSTTGPDNKRFALGTTTRISARVAADERIVEGADRLDSARCVDLKLEASNIWQAGLSAAHLKNGEHVVGVVEAIRRHAPFRLKVNGPNPERAELRLIHGIPAELRLRNEDEMGYQFRWRLELPGLPASGTAYVRPNRTVSLPLPAAQSSLGQWFESGFLRSATREGRLVVEYEPDPGLEPYALPRQEYSVHATISASGPVWQRVVNTSFIVGLLLVGIIASLLLNYTLPMQRRRVAIKQRLALLGGRLAGLGEHVPSRILSLLRVEKRRLREELRHIWPVDPTTEAALPKLEEQIDWMDRRIALVVAAGNHLASLSGGTSLAVPQADQVRAAARTVFDIVVKPQAGDDDIKRAQTALALIADLRAAAMLPPSAPLLQALGDSAAAVRTRIVAGALPQGHEKAFEELVAALLLEVPKAAPAALSCDAYVDMTLAVAKAEIVADYKHLLAGAQSADVLRRRTSRAPELLAALCPGPDQSLLRARSIVCEAEEGVSEADLVTTLENAAEQDVWIEVDPPKPLPYQLVTLRVRLRQPGLDTAVARSRIECVWGVTGGGIESDDWVASYFFEQPPTLRRARRGLARLRNHPQPAAPVSIQVKARLLYGGKDLLPVKSVEVTIEPSKSYAWASAWLSLGAMFVTMLLIGIGLIAGAQEKIQSLDWVTGVFAILALGFGADVLKRVLTRP
jgi:hypothetical protein